MAEQKERHPVLSYQPAEPAKVPLHRRVVVGFLRCWPWLGIYWIMVLCVLMLVVGRIFARHDGPYTWSSLVADLFVAWLVLGGCVTVYRFFRKGK